MVNGRDEWSTVRIEHLASRLPHSCTHILWIMLMLRMLQCPLLLSFGMCIVEELQICSEEPIQIYKRCLFFIECFFSVNWTVFVFFYPTIRFNSYFAYLNWQRNMGKNQGRDLLHFMIISFGSLSMVIWNCNSSTWWWYYLHSNVHK